MGKSMRRLRECGFEVETRSDSVAMGAMMYEREYWACIVAEEIPAGGRAAIIGNLQTLNIRVKVAFHPDLSRAQLEETAAGVLVRMARYVNDGPEPDGWQRRSDGPFQLWLTRHQLPKL